jgi:hypothetical protein
MPRISEPNQLYVAPVEVISVNTIDRVVSVSYLNSDRNKENVIVVNDSGSYSFPKVGERGLMIDVGHRSYYLGKIEYNYRDKINGNITDNSTLPPTKILAKNVVGGEQLISNIIKRTWMSLSNSGDFSLMNGLNDGLKYIRRSRLARVAGSLVRQLGTGAVSNIGAVMRTLPVVGEVVIPEPAGSVTPAVEALIEVLVLGIRFARMHIGNVKTSLGVDEILTPYGARLRAIIEVLQGPLSMGWLKIDELGNVEMGSTTAKCVLNSQVPGTGGVYLGSGLAFQQVIMGNIYTTAESTYLAAESVFLTSETTLATSMLTFMTLMTAFGSALVAGAGIATSTPGNPILNTAAIAAIGGAGSIVVGASASMIAALSTYIGALAAFTGSNAVFSGSLVGTLSLISKTL